MRFHAQNLNERGKHQRPGSMLRHGRWWLYAGKGTLGCEWSWFTSTFGVQLGLAIHDHALWFSFGCLLFSVYLTLDYPRLYWWLANKTKRADQKYGNGREIGIRVFANAIWISLWEDPMEWRSADPKWWKFTIHLVDLLLGRQKYSDRELERARVEVPMPEGAYPATVIIEECTWKRPRWFGKSRIGATITPDTPIPFPGKGENSWDCGEDATHSLSCSADTPFKAMLALTESVMKSRYRYGGPFWRPQPKKVVAGR